MAQIVFLLLLTCPGLVLIVLRTQSFPLRGRPRLVPSKVGLLRRRRRRPFLFAGFIYIRLWCLLAPLAAAGALLLAACWVSVPPAAVQAAAEAIFQASEALSVMRTPPAEAVLSGGKSMVLAA